MSSHMICGRYSLIVSVYQLASQNSSTLSSLIFVDTENNIKESTNSS